VPRGSALRAGQFKEVVRQLAVEVTYLIIIAEGLSEIPAWLWDVVGSPSAEALILETASLSSGISVVMKVVCRGKEPRLFVGTEPAMWAANRVLQKSAEMHSSEAIQWRWMSSDTSEEWRGWQRGEIGRDGWGTGFSCFRWAVPELCKFEGRAIYLDADILVLGDLVELWQTAMSRGVCSLSPHETSVMLFDCKRFASLKGWPSMAEMKQLKWRSRNYGELVSRHGLFEALDSSWNCLDGKGYRDGVTKLIHYTDRTTQPWRPHPDRFVYRAHPDAKMERLWWEHARATFSSWGVS